MIDPNKLLRMWLLTPQITLIDGAVIDNPVIPALENAPAATPLPTEQRVIAGHLQEGYDARPTGNGPAIVVRVGGSGVTSGGTAHPEIPIIDPRMQVIVWAGINEYEQARIIDGAIFDWLQGGNALDITDPSSGDPVGHILISLNQVLGQDINDPPTGWATVVSFWHLKLREN